MTFRAALIAVCDAGFVAVPQTLLAQSAHPHVPLERICKCAIV